MESSSRKLWWNLGWQDSGVFGRAWKSSLFPASFAICATPGSNNYNLVFFTTGSSMEMSFFTVTVFNSWEDAINLGGLIPTW